MRQRIDQGKVPAVRLADEEALSAASRVSPGGVLGEKLIALPDHVQHQHEVHAQQKDRQATLT
ncbi:MAG TPA: hypothetical protein VMG10_17550 [Gemmataceae bacterium]|nr:hypothetical protein [Gemmataceae bacterium]